MLADRCAIGGSTDSQIGENVYSTCIHHYIGGEKYVITHVINTRGQSHVVHHVDIGTGGFVGP